MQPSRFGKIASTDVDAEVECYKRLRRERRDGERRRTRPLAETDAHAMVRVALAWLPYGGVPADELLVHFGLTDDQFVATLWQIMADGHCAREDARDIAEQYPRSTNN